MRIDDEHPIVGSRREVVEELDQPLPHVAGDRVLASRPVDGEGHDSVVSIDEQTVHGSHRPRVSPQ
jgi:hypothetical protein